MPSVPSRSVVALLALGLVCLASPARAETTMGARFDKAVSAQPPKAAAVYDPSKNRLLWGLHAEQALPTASTIKVLTAIVAAEHMQPADMVKISHAAAYARDDQIAWREGASFSADQVIHGMLMQSSNGAAIALAQHVGGTLEGFARIANERARELGANSTRLVDPSGLDAKGQHSSAHDLSIIATALLRNEWLARVVRTKDYPVQWPDGTIAHFGNINRFIDQYGGAIGVKNGYTSLAGNVVVEAAVRGGRTLIVVLINAVHPYETAARLMDVGFKYAPIGSWQPIAQADAPATEVRAAGPETTVSAQPIVQAARAAPNSRSMPVKPFVFVIALGYCARYVQIRRRKIRRRKDQGRARVAAARAKVEAAYQTRRPDLSAHDIWLTERPFEVVDEPRTPRRRLTGSG
jgi:D-alanyl-D-alanine carboxypeptidase (penicillin-binding protein 5/6)